MTNLIYWPQIAGPVAGEQPLAHDPYFASVVQLAHFDGTNNVTGPFPNSTTRGNTITTTTGAVFSTTQFKFGSSSLAVGVANQDAKAATHADYNFGTGDWTIEFWLRENSLALDFNSVKVQYDSRPTALTNGFYPTFGSLTASGDIILSTNGVTRISGATGSLVAATWQFIACSKKSGSTRLFVDGVQVGSTYSDSDTYVQSGFTLLAAGNAAGACLGFMDELRITKGVGRYSANFTPPTNAFPNQ